MVICIGNISTDSSNIIKVINKDSGKDGGGEFPLLLDDYFYLPIGSSLQYKV